MSIIIKGRTIIEGDVQAQALVSRSPLSLSYVDAAGIITDQTHELYGQNIKDTILVLPALKGSAFQDLAMLILVQGNIAPKGIIALEADNRLVIAAAFCDIPTMDRLEKNPLETVSTGDLVRVNADEGIVEIKK